MRPWCSVVTDPARRRAVRAELLQIMTRSTRAILHEDASSTDRSGVYIECSDRLGGTRCGIDRLQYRATALAKRPAAAARRLARRRRQQADARHGIYTDLPGLYQSSQRPCRKYHRLRPIPRAWRAA